ncbi:hypothetical protein [Streptomyces sp. NPDC002889]|uniref:hypothetical protein n=1 Tax=Streptomyces sp. NPDC002889 TaxID=3364669 RepID=UPI0036996195
MESAAATPIDAVLLGTVSAPGSVEPLAQGQLAVRHGDRLELHDRAAFLDGASPSLLHARLLPPYARAAPLPDGTVVLAEGTRIRALDPGGRTRWEVPHPPWRHAPREPRPPGTPAVSPDGRLVCALVPTLAAGVDERLYYTRDTLLLLDAASGDVRARRPVGAISSDVTQRWHPDGSLLAVSCWTARYSWSTWWIEPRHDGLHIRGGTTMHEIVGFLPGTTRALTLRRAEGIAHNDDRDELASHEATADEQTAVLNLSDLATDPRSDEFDAAFLLDSAHVLVSGRIHRRGRPPATRHWLCDALTLRPLGRLRYPAPVGRHATPLGDGTWLTRHGQGERLHHWALPRQGT